MQNQEAQLKLRPVCDCGYVFHDLTATMAFPESYGLKSKIYIFNPSTCPKCGKRITGIDGKLTDGNEINFTY